MRQIVKDAKKVDELYYIFISSDDMTWDQVEDLLPDSYILSEAKYRLYIVEEMLSDLDKQDEAYNDWSKDHKQLKRFIKKYEGKCVPHKNEGITYEELRDKYIYAK